MKSITYQFAAYAWSTGGTTTFNAVTRTNTTTRPYMTAAEVYRHKAELPEVQAQTYKYIKPMLARGEWLFDPRLWKWYFKMLDAYTLLCMVEITFTNDLNESQAEFMSYIKVTGLLEKEHEVIKPYG